MKVETPKGNIKCEESTDRNNPGIWVSVNGNELVLVEFDEVRGKHVIRVWDEENINDDYEYIKELNK